MRAGLIPSRALQERRILQDRDEMVKKKMVEMNGKSSSKSFLKFEISAV